MTRTCRNPRCGEPLPLGLFCPSCRLAGAWGGALAFVAFAVGHVLRELDWVEFLRLVATW